LTRVGSPNGKNVLLRELPVWLSSNNRATNTSPRLIAENLADLDDVNVELEGEKAW